MHKHNKINKDHFYPLKWLLWIVIINIPFASFGQWEIYGFIKTAQGPLPAASVSLTNAKNQLIEGRITGTDGEFSFMYENDSPVLIKVEFLGYKTKIVEVSTDDTMPLQILLEEDEFVLDQIVVGASRFEERAMESPVTVYKLDSRRLKQFGSSDYYSAIKNMKGIQAMPSSLSLPSYNTRGFSDPANFRFKQQIDGIDMTNPIGLSISNSVGASDLDIQSIELVPGASSALYGSDAFNGMLRIYTKNPFETEGLSVLTKTGFTSQSVAGENFYGEINLRFAKKLSEKIAVKIDFTHNKAFDWIGNDDSHRIPAFQYDDRDFFNSLDIDDPNGYLRFDAVHRVGDEYGNGIGVIPFGFTLTGPEGESVSVGPREMARSGIWEGDLVDNELQNFRVNGAIHYRPGGNWEIIYGYKHSYGDWLIRSSVTFPQYDYLQRLHYGEVKNDWVSVRAYHHKLDNFRETWSAPNAADAIQRALRPDEDWVADLQANFAQTGSLKEAREFADRFMPGGSEFNQQDFEAALAATSNNTDFTGFNSNFIIGSQAVDFSSYMNADADFDLSKFLGGFKLLAGANYRRYNIESGGSFYNDGPLGFGEPIIVNQFGLYTQATDKYIDDRLRVTAALRYDWHEDYDDNWSPRLALSMALGEKRNHHIRGAIQTGFRNPSIQEGFFRLQLTSAFVVVGAAERSLDNYIHQTPSGEMLPLNDIIAESGTGFSPVQPERNTTAEIGYKALLGDRLMVDANFYHTWYQNFINRPNLFFRPGTPDFQIFAIRQNRDEQVISMGAGFQAEYRLARGLYLGASYDWADFDSPDFEPTNPDIEDEQEKEAFLRSLQFNNPEHRVYLSFSGESLGKSGRWGFRVGTYYNSSFIFFSNFGVNEVDAIQYSDASVSYRVPDINTTFKIGGSNIFRQEYNAIYGGPDVGAIYYLAIRYEDF
jgi:outer membrane receptor protein involved in Fe transport